MGVSEISEPIPGLPETLVRTLRQTLGDFTLVGVLARDYHLHTFAGHASWEAASLERLAGILDGDGLKTLASRISRATRDMVTELAEQLVAPRGDHRLLTDAPGSALGAKGRVGGRRLAGSYANRYCTHIARDDVLMPQMPSD